jgi:hypothetical protein
MNLDLELSPAQVGIGLAAVGVVFEVFSSLTSSPWTMENFGADEQRAKSARYYVAAAAVISGGIGLGYAWLAGSWWPLIGVVVASGGFVVIYLLALARGKAAGNMGWAAQNSPGFSDTAASAAAAVLSESGRNLQAPLRVL